MNLHKVLPISIVALLLIAPHAIADITGPQARCEDAIDDAGVDSVVWDADAGVCRFLSIQTAIDFAEPGEAVLVAHSSEAPYPESLVIETNHWGQPLDGLTLCSAADGGHDHPVSLGQAVECEPAAEHTVVDSSGIMVDGRPAIHVLQVRANDVTVQGLTLRSTVQYVEEVVGTDAKDPLLPSGPSGNPVVLVQQTQQAWIGVLVSGDGLEFTENVIEVRGGPCVAEVTVTGPSPCNAIPATGLAIVPGADDAQIVDNLLQANVRAHEGTVVGAIGITAAGKDYLVANNTIQNWLEAGVRVTPTSDGGIISGNAFLDNALYGVHLDGASDAAAPAISGNAFSSLNQDNLAAGVLLDDRDGVVVSDNSFVGLAAPATGVWVRGSDDVRLLANQFQPFAVSPAQAGLGVLVDVDDTGAAPESLVLRHNVFALGPGMSQYALSITPEVQLTDVDARLNDWSVYTWGQVSARVLDGGVTNTVQLLPFLGASDTA